MSFSQDYKKIYALVKSDIEEVNNKLLDGFNLPQPLLNELKDFLFSPSKRIRPTLVLLYLKANNMPVTSKVYEILALIELVHNASLIHDDVIDEGKTRRNYKTLNCKFDNKLAVVSGDYILSVVLEKLNRINNPDLLIIFAKTLQNMCLGEVNQYFNKNKITSIDEYLKKTYQKTASLFEAAVMSAFIASTGKNDIIAKDFGKNFGIAFQIRDDLINVLEKDTSKSSDDIPNGIYNAPVIYAEQTNDLEIGIEKTRVLLQNYINEAKKLAEPIEENEYKSALIALTELLNND